MRARKNPYARPDRFTRAAKDAGYPARSVFKLEEIDRRTRLLRPGMRVLDLGAAPGSWAMYAAQKIGRTGKLLAVDLGPLPREVTLPPNAVFLQADVFDLPVSGEGPRNNDGMAEGPRNDHGTEALAELGPYDVVLSDMAPKTTGNRITDQARSYELFMRALAVAGTLGKPGSSFVGKIFMGDDLPNARAELRARYGHERIIRPQGTRSVSTELFLVGTEKRP